MHTSLKPKTVAYTVANDGRQFVECDRVSVAHPDFLAIIERSRSRYETEGGISLEKIRQKYGA